MHYKGTKEQCEAYNSKVITGEKYSGSTQQWATVEEYEGEFYIFKHDNYNSKMETVDSIPCKDEQP